MAKRRMFSTDVIDTDSFLDMPSSSKCLYYDLGMRADDDGFVSPKKVIRVTGASADDLKVLIVKKFIIPFESGVIVIRDWKMNNYIQKDRYTETIYKDEKKLLTEDENSSYGLKNPDVIQNVYNLDTQVSIGKDRLGKVIEDNGVSKKTPSCPLLLNSPLKEKYTNGHKECVDYMVQTEKIRGSKFVNQGKQYMFLHKVLRSEVGFDEMNILISKIEKKYGKNQWDFSTISNWLDKGGILNG